MLGLKKYAAVVWFAAPIQLAAGTIYGSVYVDSKPASGFSLEFQSSGDSQPLTVRLDTDGAFNIRLPDGRFSVRVISSNGTRLAETSVISYSDPQKYILQLVPRGDGTYEVVRR